MAERQNWQALKLVLLAVAALSIVGCDRARLAPAGREQEPASSVSPSSRTSVKLHGKTMGTTWNVTLVHPKVDAARTNMGPVAIQATLDRVNGRMSTWQPQSELSRFNAAVSTEPFSVSAETAMVVAHAITIGENTDGAFDVTLGPLIRLWGFDGGGQKKKVPSREALASAKARIGLTKLHVTNKTLQKDEADLEVNLSGIAKGYGVDAVAADLTLLGFSDFMVEVGGEVRTAGHNAKGKAWKLGVNVPRSDADPRAVLRTVAVSGRALATSGNYRNYFEAGGKRYAHVLDPRIGAPTEHDLVSVTILADDCMTADGLATAALVVGEEKTRAFLKAHYPGVEALFVHVTESVLVGRQKTKLRVTATDGFPQD